MQRGFFRYDVTACETKMIPGKYGFIAQLNEGRHLKKRLTNFRVDKVLQPFDESKFNFTKVVSDASICLQDNNIPYNVLISDCRKRIFLLPQCCSEKQALGEASPELLDTQVNPAVWEISGHMVLKRKKDYDEASEENAWRLLAEVSLSEERFKEVNDLIFEAISYSCNTSENESQNSVEDQSPEDVDAIKSSHHPIVPGTQECLVLH